MLRSTRGMLWLFVCQIFLASFWCAFLFRDVIDKDQRMLEVENEESSHASKGIKFSALLELILGGVCFLGGSFRIFRRGIQNSFLKEGGSDLITSMCLLLLNRQHRLDCPFFIIVISRGPETMIHLSV